MRLKLRILKLYSYGNQLKVIAKIKNNSNEQKNIDYMNAEFLDSNDNVISPFIIGGNDPIESHESKNIECYLMDVENAEQITNARIDEIVMVEKTDQMEEMENGLE